MIDYVNQLREGIVDAYVGIVQGLKTGENGKFHLLFISGEDLSIA